MSYRSGYLVGAAATGGLGDWFGNGGNSLPSQLWSWVTGTVPEASDDPPAVQSWRAGVKARGDVAVRWPYNDPFRGELAERETNTDADGSALGYTYYLAPLDVINADRARRNLDAIAGNVLLPLADAGLSVAQVASGVLFRGALVTAGLVVAVNAIAGAMRGRR